MFMIVIESSKISALRTLKMKQKIRDKNLAEACLHLCRTVAGILHGCLVYKNYRVTEASD